MIRIAVLLALLATPALASTDPATAVGDFYGVYVPLHVKGGGIPDATARVRYQPVLSPRLNKLIADAAAAQARLTAKVKNAVPPMLEGDVFSSLFEGASDYQIGECRGDAKTARCPVALSYVPPVIPGKKAEKPAKWNDTVVVVMTRQGWKVDDVIYDAGFAFGNTGRLSSMLQMVISQNP